MMECQVGVVGGNAVRLGALADAVARHGLVARIAKLVDAAHAAGVPVFHLTVARRPDSGGSSLNCLLFAATRKGTPLVPGSPEQAIVPELAPEPGDYVLTRFHGVTPFHATELDQLLRNLGIRTV